MIYAIDQKILTILQDAGRISHSKFGRSLDKPASAVFDRQERLEDQSVIRELGAPPSLGTMDFGPRSFSVAGARDLGHSIQAPDGE